MNSSMKPIEYPIAAEGGVVAPVADVQDPFETLDNLMFVVEALCPTWPQRETFSSTGQMRL